MSQVLLSIINKLSWGWRTFGLIPFVSEYGKGKQLLLRAGKLHNHHAFPQQFRAWFAARGIDNIDDYTVRISEKLHLKGVHGKGLAIYLDNGINNGKPLFRRILMHHRHKYFIMLMVYYNDTD